MNIPRQITPLIDAGADVVFSMSGGKDSTATYLYALESGLLDRIERAGGQVKRVFADTGWEFDETYDYLDTLAKRFGPIDRVATWVPGPNEAPPDGYALLEPIWKTEKGGDGGVMHGDRYAYARLIEARLGHYSPLVRLMLEWRKVPMSARRWCTDDTKKRPLVAYLAECADPVNVIGVRAEESRKRANMPDHAWSDEYDAWVWRIIHDWTKQDVIDVHHRHGLAPNPIYLQGEGTARVGCGPCVNSGRDDLRWLAKEHPERLRILAEIERCIEALDPPRKAKGHSTPRWFTVSGRGGMTVSITVDEAVRLASDDLGGDAPLMFKPQRAPGCQEWGMCSW